MPLFKYQNKRQLRKKEKKLRFSKKEGENPFEKKDELIRKFLFVKTGELEICEKLNKETEKFIKKMFFHFY